jgi:parvulin-like peptidyl-prolyl isomerase
MKISFTARLFIYFGVLLYISADLYWFSGPLHTAVNRRKVDSPEMIEEAKRTGIAALVLGRPVTTSQLERAARERLWLEGKSWDEVPRDQRVIVRKACLMDLIDHQLIRSKIAANKESERASEEEISERIKQLLARFVSRSDMEQSMQAQGIATEAELRLRIAAMIEQEKYIARQLQPLVQVSEDETKDFYEKHQTALALPEMISVRHVFWATLDKEADAVQKSAETALQSLLKKEKTFEQLAIEMSGDERSKKMGGQLGWISRGRLSADFTSPAFALQKNQPSLIRTKLGWHLVEVIDRREAKTRTFEECRKEIELRVSEQKRPEALQNIRAAIRKSHQEHIHIYDAVLDGLP